MAAFTMERNYINLSTFYELVLLYEKYEDVFHARNPFFSEELHLFCIY